MTKEQRELVKLLERKGIAVVSVTPGRKHYRFRLQGPGGPVLVVPASGSDRRGHRNTVRDARRLCRAANR